MRVTALARYAQLESLGHYFEKPSAPPLEVVVGFGVRTLVVFAPGDRVIAHWPLASLRALTPRGTDRLLLVPAQDAEERLVVEDPEMIDAISKVCRDLYRRPVDRRGLRRAGLIGAATLTILGLVLFWLLPTFASAIVPLIPAERERALGETLMRQVAARMVEPGRNGLNGFCRGTEGAAALDRLVARLAPGADLPHPLAIEVLDHGLVNAVALPGSRILLFRGLIDTAESPEEIAGVLAHEMGHLIHRDPMAKILQTAGTTGILGLVLGDTFGSGIAKATGEAALNARYQDETEARADETAHALLERASLPTRPFAAFLRQMEAAEGEASAPPDWLATHPAPVDRAALAEQADKIGDGQFTPALNDRDWVALKGICAGS